RANWRSLLNVSSSKAINLRMARQPLQSNRARPKGPRAIIGYDSCRRNRSSAQYAVFPEPALHQVPGILGCFLAVARAVIGVEPMRRRGVDLEIRGLLVFGQRRLQRLYGGDGNPGIRIAIKAENRCLHLGCELGRTLGPERVRCIHRRTIEGSGGL